MYTSLVGLYISLSFVTKKIIHLSKEEGRKPLSFKSIKIKKESKYFLSENHYVFNLKKYIPKKRKRNQNFFSSRIVMRLSF